MATLNTLFSQITTTLKPVANGKIERAAKAAASDQKRRARAMLLCEQLASGTHKVKRYDTAERQVVDRKCAPGTFVMLAIKAAKNGATAEQLIETKLAERFEWKGEAVQALIFEAAREAKLTAEQTTALTKGFGILADEDKVVPSEPAPAVSDEANAPAPVDEAAVVEQAVAEALGEASAKATGTLAAVKPSKRDRRAARRAA